MPSNKSPHDPAKPSPAQGELRAQIESTIHQARLQIANFKEDAREEDSIIDADPNHENEFVASEREENWCDENLCDENWRDENWLDENWLGDDKLQELASQLNSDATHLANSYPASNEAVVERASSHIDYRPALPIRRVRAGRRMLGLFSAIGLALASLLVLTPWLISLQDNQRNLSTEGSRAVAQSGSHADQEDLGQSASIGVSVHAQQGHAQPHIETVAVDEDLNDETADRERSLDEKSATAVGLDSEVTDVSYRSSLPLDIRNPLIYHANQAELEGLIDVVEGTPEKKIRIGF